MLFDLSFLQTKEKTNKLEYKIDDFLSGYGSAFSRAINFENKITSDISSLSTSFSLSPLTSVNITDMIALSLRQTIGSLEFTTSRLSNGQLAGVDDLRVFIKDVGSSLCVQLFLNLNLGLFHIFFIDYTQAHQSCGNYLRFFPGLSLSQRFSRGYIA